MIRPSYLKLPALFAPAVTIAALATAPACVQFEDEDATAGVTTDTGGGADDVGADDVSTADVTDATDGPLLGGNFVQAPITDVPACADVPVSFPVEIAGCGYSFDPPRWQQPNAAGTAGILDATMSCGEVGANAEPRYVHVTYPTNDASKNAAILWMTGADTRVSQVRFGLSEDALDWYASGWTFTYSLVEGERVVHEVHVCGLQPATTYYYQAGGEGAWSDTYTFTTAPEYLSDEPFRFGVTGDTRSPTQAMWGQALDAMEGHGIDFFVFTGDAVDIGSIQEQWDVWWENGEATETTDRLASLPMIYAHGNHDLVGDPMWAMMAYPRNEQSYYTRVGNALFITLDDSGFFLTQERNEGAIREFLDEALQAHPDVTWRFVSNHKGIYSASTRHGSQLDLQDAWLDLIEEYDVDMVFNGHDHNYERSCSVRGQQCVADGQGTVYLIAAGIGAPLYDNGDDWWTEESASLPTYAVIDIDGNTLSGTAYDLDGNVVDTWTITKP